jgi:hypothetical protein
MSDRVRVTEAQHQFCTHNKQAILDSKFCGCFGCRSVFRASEVENYGYAEDDFGEDGEVVGGIVGNDTALCPECGGPYVMPSNKVEITPELLVTMQEEWIEPDDEEQTDGDDSCGDCDAVYGSEACLTCDYYEEDDVETPVPDDDTNDDDDDKEEDDNPDE